VELCAVRTCTDDGAVCRALTAQARERVLDDGLQLVLVRRLRGEHGGAVAFGTDLTGLAKERELGRRLLGAQLIDDVVGVLDGEACVPRRDRLHERAAARQ
jgi:hypothetical protein